MTLPKKNGKKDPDALDAETPVVDDAVTPLLYPGWRFSPRGDKQLVHNADDEQALGKGWYRSRAEAEKATKK